jgi:glycosyltransferase involved in cell wall biosynthesis
VAIEAMACGVPLVATGVGGLAESVVDDVTGLLVPARCPAAIAGALDRLLGDPPLRARMGAAGAVRARRFGWDRIAAETLEVAHCMLEGAVRQPPAGHRRSRARDRIA